MLKRFDRYLLRQVSLMSGATLSFLLLIDFIVQFSGDLDEGYPLTLWLRFLFWQWPEKILLFLPAALLVGAILGLGQLAKEHELMVMQAAGVSRLRLLLPALCFAAFFSAGFLATLEALSPVIQKQQQQLNQWLGREKQGDIWLRTPQEWVRIERLQGDGHLGGVHLYRLEGEDLIYIYAASASYQHHAWLLHQAQQWQVNMQRQTQKTGDWFWENATTPQQWHQLRREKTFSSLREMRQSIDFLKKNGIEARQEALRWWQRLCLPLTAMTMMLLAMPFVFGSQRQAAQGARLVFGILLGVAYYLLQTMLANMALLLSWSAWLSALMPNAIALTLLLLIQKKRQI